MKLITRVFEHLIYALIALACGSAAAQDFPSKPIRIVVPFPPGGSADVLARTIGVRLSTALGQPVVIDNKPGAGGILGADIVAKSPADGHTLLFANTNIAINPSLYKTLPYDTAATFAPVVLMVTVPNLLLVADDVKAATLGELIALAKNQPGALNYASAGNGTFPHLAVELFWSKLLATLRSSKTLSAVSRSSPKGLFQLETANLRSWLIEPSSAD